MDTTKVLLKLIIDVCNVLYDVHVFAGEGFSVAFDPLDGSSIVDTNFTVGTIFGVWPGDKLIGVTGRDQVHSPSSTGIPFDAAFTPFHSPPPARPCTPGPCPHPNPDSPK